MLTGAEGVPPKVQIVLAGAVLAGGRSQRMGTDKAALLWKGEPLWRRQWRVLEEAGAHPIGLVRRPDQSDLGAEACWRDRRSDAGPMAGLEAALRECATPFVAVLAVDMPRIDANWFTWLATACAPASGAVAGDAGQVEPLAAIYPREAANEIAGHLDRGVYSLQHLNRALVSAGLMTVIELTDARRVQACSVNEPSDAIPP